jgi:hypothetical protein
MATLTSFAIECDTFDLFMSSEYAEIDIEDLFNPTIVVFYMSARRRSSK